jgi:ABC-type phosphonate transport system ATPase subunit
MTDSETLVLTDLEMTNLIVKLTTRGKKRSVRELWLDFTEDKFDSVNGDEEKFIAGVNYWLQLHKIPIKVVSFNQMDEDIGGTDWTIQHIQKDSK